MPVTNIFRTIIIRIKNHIIILSILHLGEKVGIQITPYYLNRESFSDNLGIDREPGLKPLFCGFISQSDIAELYSYPEIRGLKSEWAYMQDRDNLCFALKHNDNIAAYLWCNLHRCNSNFMQFPLKKGEAYVFRVRTLRLYRGLNLAPFLRYRLYQSLASAGYSQFYSITEYFNAPAARVAQKLKAKPLKLSLYFSLFGKLKWNINLKDYSIGRK